MIKYLFTSIICFFIVSQATAQLNMTLMSNLDYNDDCSDVWGYAAPDGSEYALVGTYSGTSIVNISDPVNPVEVQFIPGPNSIWRDIKVWEDHAYVTNETGSGLAVIDLSNLPSSAPFYNWEPNIAGLGQLGACHNIYIDEFGYAYIAGCNLNSGGPIILDVHTTPNTPIYVNHTNPVYSHDIYAKNNLLYSADIYAGVFSITDVTDKTNLQVLATQGTPFNFTHNVWISQDENTIFTTDEQGDAPVASYDISDLSNIELLDEFRPLQTLGQGVIPHNVFSMGGDWIVISYYTDGCIVVDAKYPDNLIEVGYFDTWAGSNGGFDGAWGSFPYFPSGLVAVSDINNGLYILEPNYVRACYLEGTVTDNCLGNGIGGVNVSIDGTLVNETTKVDGTFKTGILEPGVYNITFSKAGYPDQTKQVTLATDVIVTENVDMASGSGGTLFTMDIQVTDMGGTPLPNAQIVFSGSAPYETTTDANGIASVPCFAEGTYNVIVGKWGYKTKAYSNETLNQSSGTFQADLESGYKDEFALDLGWVVSGDAQTGMFELVDPDESTFGSVVSSPENDISGDIGYGCYVTGNGGNGGSNDVDGGTTRITSPVFDLTTYNNPKISYHRWFFNDGGNGNPDDSFVVKLSNGTQTVTVETTTTSASQWVGPVEFVVSDFITITNTMTITFETSDLGSGHIVEALLDGFEVIASPLSTNNPEFTANVKALPNPFSNEISIDFDLEKWNTSAQLNVINTLGQIVNTQSLAQKTGIISLGQKLETGVYFINIEVDGEIVHTSKIIKSN